MNAFLDTNILLDVILERTPFVSSAARVWAMVERKEIIGSISAVSVNNVYYLTRKYRGANHALEMVRILRELFVIVPLDETTFEAALQLSIPDFEDAIQAASAVRAKSEFLITRNLADFLTTAVPAVTAEEFLALQAQNVRA